MFKYFLSLYTPGYPRTIVYMIQSTEYKVGSYIKWLNRTTDFQNVIRRRDLVRTRAASLLLATLLLGIMSQIVAGIAFIVVGIVSKLTGDLALGAALLLSYPLVWAYIITIPLILGRLIIVKPKEKRLIRESEKAFVNSKAIKIAIAGSYGKTTMKELLSTVLSERLKVASTPANKNVAISHARFAKSLKGDEDVLIIEYGEGEPGDIMKFAKTTHPTHGVITGLAPAHLDKYKTLEAAGEDIFSLSTYLKGENVYVNSDSQSLKNFIEPEHNIFSSKGALGWRARNVKSSINGTEFELVKGNRLLKLKSSLIGEHQVGFLSFVAAFGLHLGLREEEIIQGVAKTRPFEHRLQPYNLGGAWIIDDTYNGNLEGIRVGTRIMETFKARRKIYVTPGLVDQGAEASVVHREMGKLITAASPDIVVLMKNSATKDIETGLKGAKFKGDLRIEDDPLSFYLNLQHFVADGDLILMQNDWTDNYV